MHINELKAKSPQQLLKMAEDMGIENPAQLNVQQLRFAVMRVFAADKKVTLIGDGVLERMQDGFGFLRAPESIQDIFTGTEKAGAPLDAKGLLLQDIQY